MKKLSLIIPVWIALLAACTNELPHPYKDRQEELIINALLNADSVYNKVYIHKTGWKDATLVKDAQVEVYVNEKLMQIAPFVELIYNDGYGGGYIPDTGGYYPGEGEPQTRFNSYYEVTTPFNPGDRIRIEATSADGKLHAWGETSVPEKNSILTIDTVTVVTSVYPDNYSSEYLSYKIHFRDISEKDHYYKIMFEQHADFHYERKTGADSIVREITYLSYIKDDIILTDGKPYVDNDGIFGEVYNYCQVFDNSRFRNTECTLTLYQSVWGEHISSVWEEEPVLYKITRRNYVRLLTITEEAFRYYKALNVYLSDMDMEGIYEPLKYPSNVVNGSGIVTVSTEEESMPIELPEPKITLITWD